MCLPGIATDVAGGAFPGITAAEVALLGTAAADVDLFGTAAPGTVGTGALGVGLPLASGDGLGSVPDFRGVDSGGIGVPVPLGLAAIGHLKRLIERKQRTQRSLAPRGEMLASEARGQKPGEQKLVVDHRSFGQADDQ